MEKVNTIQNKLKITHSRQKSYTNVRRRDLEFVVMIRSIWRFHRRSMLWYLLRRENTISNTLVVIKYPRDMECSFWVGASVRVSSSRSVFHIPMLNKCLGNPAIIVTTEIGIKDNYLTRRFPFRLLIIMFASWEQKRLHQWRSYEGFSLLMRKYVSQPIL